MRILQVVTLVSPDGAYGGPTRVAVNQARALRALGHEVTVAGAHRGFDRPPESQDSVPLELFRARRLLPRSGFAGLTSPGLHRWSAAHLREFDVIHVHLARDLVTLPVALLAVRRGVPLVVQTHGMVDRSTKRSARLLDAIVTRRVLRAARHVLHLTADERDELRHVGGPGLRLVRLPNGVPETPLRAGDGTEVLFLARLAERKRPLTFAAAATALHATRPELRFAVVGPDEGELPALRAYVRDHDASSYLSHEGPVPPSATLERMSRAAVYVLPAVDEPYPMAVLEAMSIGLPVVVTDSCGLADEVAAAGAGAVVDDSTDQLVAALDRLFAHPDERRAAGANAHTAARERFGMAEVAARLEELYVSAG